MPVNLLLKFMCPGPLLQYVLVSPFCYGMDYMLEIPAHLLSSGSLLFIKLCYAENSSLWLCLFVSISLLCLWLFCFSFHISVHISQCHTLIEVLGSVGDAGEGSRESTESHAGNPAPDLPLPF